MHSSYKLRRLDEPEEERVITEEPTRAISPEKSPSISVSPTDKESISKMLSLSGDYALSVQVDAKFLDDIEKCENYNEMIEHIMATFATLTEDAALQKSLLDNSLLDVVKTFFDQAIDSAVTNDEVDETADGIDLLSVMPTGTLNLLKSCSEILLNISAGDH